MILFLFLFITETLVKPGSLLIRNCNAAQFPRFTSSLANLNRSAIPNVNNYTKCHILFKVDSVVKFYKQKR